MHLLTIVSVFVFVYSPPLEVHRWVQISCKGQAVHQRKQGVFRYYWKYLTENYVMLLYIVHWNLQYQRRKLIKMVNAEQNDLHFNVQ